MDFKEEQKIRPEEFSKADYKKFVLTGDVGGTNTNLAVFGIADRPVPVFRLDFASQQVDEFKDPVNETLRYAKEKYDIEISDACFGVAGPLYENRQLGKLTNIKWEVDVRLLKEGTLLKNILLINDFEAIGFGIEVLPETDMEELAHPDKSTPRPQEKETKAVIGAGTGLGEGILVYEVSKRGYVPVASEGGHCDIAARTDMQQELVKFLIEHNLCSKSSYPGWEEVLSGRGIVSIFKFLTNTRKVHAKEETILLLEKSDDKAATIAKLAAEGEDACRMAMENFFELYGQESALLALKAKALGGIYIAGGIAAKNMALLRKGNFMRAFDATKAPDHPLHRLIRQVPVFVIMNYEVSLYGAANAAANYLDIF